MPADTMKMPEPIIDPVTTMVESNSPSSRLKSVSSASGLAVTSAIRQHYALTPILTRRYVV
jgi:hypothetical protein